MADINLPCLQVAGKRERPAATLGVFSRQLAVGKTIFRPLLPSVADLGKAWRVALVEWFWKNGKHDDGALVLGLALAHGGGLFDRLCGAAL